MSFMYYLSLMLGTSQKLSSKLFLSGSETRLTS